MLVTRVSYEQPRGTFVRRHRSAMANVGLPKLASQMIKFISQAQYTQKDEKRFFGIEQVPILDRIRLRDALIRPILAYAIVALGSTKKQKEQLNKTKNINK